LRNRRCHQLRYLQDVHARYARDGEVAGFAIGDVVAVLRPLASQLLHQAQMPRSAKRHVAILSGRRRRLVLEISHHQTSKEKLDVFGTWLHFPILRQLTKSVDNNTTTLIDPSQRVLAHPCAAPPYPSLATLRALLAPARGRALGHVKTGSVVGGGGCSTFAVAIPYPRVCLTLLFLRL
jgi:hypothetical protein